MAFCGKCGTQLSDGAKFCPKCGNPVGVTKNQRETRIEREIPNESFTENREVEEEGLSSLEKIALGAAGVIAIFGICYGAFESHYIVTISILAILAIGYGFIGGIERKHIWTTVIGSIVAVFLAIGVFSSDDNDREATSDTSFQQAEKKDSSQDFFENGHKYSTTFRITDEFGHTTNYNYVIKLFNDGTKEISMPNKGEDWSSEANGTHSCTIEKNSGSYRDVYASWYEVHYSYYTSIGGKHPQINEVIYVDENGNVVIPTNKKNIYEAIATKDCIYGKFKKEKLGNNVYRCKKCGKEYDPGKEAIYSEEFCYMDYPQTCKTCGKTYTVNSTSEKYKNYVCFGTCGPCYYEHRQRAAFDN